MTENKVNFRGENWLSSCHIQLPSFSDENVALNVLEYQGLDAHLWSEGLLVEQYCLVGKTWTLESEKPAWEVTWTLRVFFS